MKKLLALLLVLMMVAAIVVGCAKPEAPATDAPAQDQQGGEAEAPAEETDFRSRMLRQCL